MIAIANALAASLAAFAQDVPIEQIRTGLSTFRALGQPNTRRDELDLGSHHALADSQSPYSYEALGGSAIGQVSALQGGPGDRRDEDFVTLGKLSRGNLTGSLLKKMTIRGSLRGSVLN